MKAKIMITLLACALAACGGEQKKAASTPSAPPSASATQTAPAASTPAHSGTVVQVASDLRYQPYTYMDGMGHPSGLDVDILNAIGQKKGLSFKFNTIIWDNLYKDMNQVGTQVVANGLARDDADESQVLFSEPYHNSLDCVATVGEEAMNTWTKGKIASIPDDELIEELMPIFGIGESQVVRVDSHYLGLTSILKKQADAFVSDCTAIRYNANGDTLKNSKFVVKELTHNKDTTGSDLVFAVRKDQPELLQKINEGLAELKQSGELDKIKAKWRQ